MFTYRAIGILISSGRGSGARSLGRGANMPDGKPWVVRMGSHRELWPSEAPLHGESQSQHPSLQRRQEVTKTMIERWASDTQPEQREEKTRLGVR